jgi:hypothetical protein
MPILQNKLQLRTFYLLVFRFAAASLLMSIIHKGTISQTFLKPMVQFWLDVSYTVM